MRNKVFEPLFGKPVPEVVDTLSSQPPVSPTPIRPTPPKIQTAKSNLLGQLGQLDENKKKLLWIALALILFLVLVYLLSNQKKSKRRRRNPKRLISRFKNASKRESLEED